MLNTGSPGRLPRIEVKVRNDIYRVYCLMCFLVFKHRGSVITAARYNLSSALMKSKVKGGLLADNPLENVLSQNDSHTEYSTIPMHPSFRLVP